MTGRTPKFPLRLDQMATPRKTLVKAPQGSATTTTLKPATPAPVTPRPLLRPQQPLQHAATESARKTAPTGLGLDSVGVRQRMVERLRAEGLDSNKVLAAMAMVPRHQFVDAALVTQAYEDTSLPIGHGQTISKPSVVGRMIELLLEGANAQVHAPSATPLARVLEIGTGCGYQAAVLAQVSRQVISVERLKPLHDKARDLMAPLRLHNVRLVYGDGMLGHAPNAPYDGIIAAAGGDALPQAWLDQLAVGGRIVAPVREGDKQVLVVVDRHEQGFQRSIHEVVQFVPLRSGTVR
ncbi:protein-L-isoaspartate(D-aspartate) O-methyltransferase [Piscinibacter terrae]|uniref:Protein-L-isoaspartate O-methyltransferase n=1 Tax=Piscinibacter terrae TaxID=2496871 RepID=A0A3N7IT77_9BURK|nr:protein-L-isoaspartate(D-aspartate) O-methyltransferase [Albitalea terrae]RQP22042.1 protein-L-isoaspartate(D-aspartate) O-methyltransferase [Albitalea terrae]